MFAGKRLMFVVRWDFLLTSGPRLNLKISMLRIVVAVCPDESNKKPNQIINIQNRKKIDIVSLVESWM